MCRRIHADLARIERPSVPAEPTLHHPPGASLHPSVMRPAHRTLASHGFDLARNGSSRRWPSAAAPRPRLSNSSGSLVHDPTGQARSTSRIFRPPFANPPPRRPSRRCTPVVAHVGVNRVNLKARTGVSTPEIAVRFVSVRINEAHEHLNQKCPTRNDHGK